MSVIRIHNAAIADGTGKGLYTGDVWIQDDRIAAVGESPVMRADRVIEARGRVVSPGFIDIHRHPDVRPFTAWRGEAELRQGISTVVAGNCGISLTPSSPEHKFEMYAFDEPVLGPVPKGVPESYADYMEALDNRPLPMNFAAMIGTGSVRVSVKGFSDTPFTPGEMASAKALIADALKHGAPGVSLGVMYLPEYYTSADEYAQMLAPVGEAGSLITAHIRGEGSTLVDSVAEIISIARRAGCALEISHFKCCDMSRWRRDIHSAIALIDAARAAGQDVAVDFYPYDGGSTALTTLLPPVFVNGNMKEALARLGTGEGVQAFREASRRHYPDWDNSAVQLGWDRIIISGVVREENRRFLGMTVEAAARAFGYEDPEALAAHLMHSEAGKTAIITRSMCQDDIDAVARLSYSTIISDAIYAETDTPHPRMFGAMPRAVRQYAVERRLLPLEEVIRKMTQMPARRMGLAGRGELKAGYFADVAMFDADSFRDQATYDDPTRLATGLDLLLINGKTAVENDALVRADAGRCLRVKR